MVYPPLTIQSLLLLSWSLLSGQKVERYRQDVYVQRKKLIHNRIPKTALPRFDDLSDASSSKHQAISQTTQY